MIERYKSCTTFTWEPEARQRVMQQHSDNKTIIHNYYSRSIMKGRLPWIFPSTYRIYHLMMLIIVRVIVHTSWHSGLPLFPGLHSSARVTDSPPYCSIWCTFSGIKPFHKRGTFWCYKQSLPSSALLHPKLISSNICNTTQLYAQCSCWGPATGESCQLRKRGLLAEFWPVICWSKWATQTLGWTLCSAAWHKAKLPGSGQQLATVFFSEDPVFVQL